MTNTNWRAELRATLSDIQSRAESSQKIVKDKVEEDDKKTVDMRQSIIDTNEVNGNKQDESEEEKSKEFSDADTDCDPHWQLNESKVFILAVNSHLYDQHRVLR